MTKHELKTGNDKIESEGRTDNSNVSPMPRDPIEPDPMNPVSVPPPADTEPTERPDLDWAEHED